MYETITVKFTHPRDGDIELAVDVKTNNSHTHAAMSTYPALWQNIVGEIKVALGKIVTNEEA